MPPQTDPGLRESRAIEISYSVHANRWQFIKPGKRAGVIEEQGYQEP